MKAALNAVETLLEANVHEVCLDLGTVRKLLLIIQTQLKALDVINKQQQRKSKLSHRIQTLMDNEMYGNWAGDLILHAKELEDALGLD